MATQKPDFMHIALDLARQAASKGEVPVGAIVVHNNNIIASAHNLTETERDPTAHAEILAIRTACAALGDARLPDCDLYVTLEPCAMCAAAISFARIRRLYFAAFDTKGGAVENGTRFYTQATCHHAPEIYGGIAEAAAAQMLKDFFKDKR